MDDSVNITAADDVRADVPRGELVSIITPVYNAAATLERCVDSLRAQTHRNLQILLVDDGSSDGSPALCDELAARDARIEVIHQTNGGPAAARNAGLDATRGEWLMFVDSDDCIEAGYITDLLAVAAETQADVVVSDSTFVEEGRTRHFGMVVPDMFYGERDELWQDFLSDRIPWSLWAKLYRTELFEGLRFDPADYIAEDLDANARIFAREDLRVATSANTGYCYTVAQGSVDHSFTERHLCQFDIFERVVQLVEREGIQTTTSAEVFYEERMLNCLRKALTAKALTPQIEDAFKRAIALHRAEVLADPNASSGLKLRMRATRLGPKAYGVLNKLYPG